jgi:hypothetical protein
LVGHSGSLGGTSGIRIIFVDRTVRSVLDLSHEKRYVNDGLTEPFSQIGGSVE